MGQQIKMAEKEQMNIVIVGHVDHGKSTVVGRLLADTNTLPEGKLEQVKERCKRESKVFEYAFLLDALKDEQSQGITIDSARCFFKSNKRDYIIIDAPGHIEFLKNMISGAARAEAAVLVIDAHEGIQENSKRHGYMLSMLGIKQIIVCVNKMDLVNYDKTVFENIKKDYTEFLTEINITPKEFIPVSGLMGDNIAENSENLNWFEGNNILTALDSFEKEPAPDEQTFRMPVEDVYKFTGEGDDRRIVAGRVESGTIKVGDKVVFLPSNKQSTIKSIEEFNHEPRNEIGTGYSTGVTLNEQIYVNRGDIMCKKEDKLPCVSSLLKVSIFWMGRNPMTYNKEYKLKIGTAKIPMKLKEITKVMDASNLSNVQKEIIERHEVAECILECSGSIAFDLSSDLEATSRFVIVDEFDIAGGGIISEFIDDNQSEIRSQVFLREEKWDVSQISFDERSTKYGQVPKLIFITGKSGIDKRSIAKTLEKELFNMNRKVYFLGIGNLLRGLDSDVEKETRKEHIRRLGEVSHILMDAGLIVVACASDLTSEELKELQTITYRKEMVVIHTEEPEDKSIVDLVIHETDSVDANVAKILDFLRENKIIFSL